MSKVALVVSPGTRHVLRTMVVSASRRVVKQLRSVPPGRRREAILSRAASDRRADLAGRAAAVGSLQEALLVGLAEEPAGRVPPPPARHRRGKTSPPMPAHLQ